MNQSAPIKNIEVQGFRCALVRQRHLVQIEFNVRTTLQRTTS